MEMKKQYFIAPDNGSLTLLFNENTAACLVRLTNSNFFLDTVSPTFHGRDIIAPVGAHISQGVDLHQLGDETAPDHAVRLANIYPRLSDAGEIVGTVVAVDHFGNLISNIDYQMLKRFAQAVPEHAIRIRIGSHTIHGIYQTYENVRRDTALGLIGSRGYLEVAVNMGNAARILKAGKGDAVRVTI
jgi:S-adenosylmethionine hydrolase